MRGFIGKYKGLKFLACYAVLCSLCAVALGVNSDEASGESRLEQRMKMKVSIDVKDVSIRTIIETLTDQAGADFYISPKVEDEKLSFKISDVPLEEALRSILEGSDYDFIAGENIIRILPTAQMPQATERLETKIFEIKYADITEVVKALKDFSKAPGASVSSIAGTSHIIVTNTEPKLRDIEKFIETIDRMTPQVLVEARIYDITSKYRFDLGIQWQAGRTTEYDSTASPVSGSSLSAVGGADDLSRPGGKTSPFTTGVFGGAGTQVENAQGYLRLGFLNSSIDIDAILRAQKQNIHAKLLANPRILVLDNEKATIKIVTQIPYQQLQQGRSSSGSFGTTSFREVGVTLEVTPHVATGDEMIRLHLLPKFSVQTGSVNVGSSSEAAYPQPIIDEREAETKLLVKNGETVVLGGLRKKDVAHEVNKIPILGDIPLAGALFKFKSEETVLSEIIVFITPRIVEQPVVSDDMTESEKQAYEETEFGGPVPTQTKAEKRAAEKE